MAYANYNNVTLVFNTGVDNANTEASLLADTDAQTLTVAATNVSVNSAANLQTVQLLGRDSTREDMRMAGPANHTLSFSCILHTGANTDLDGEFNVFDYTGKTVTGCTVAVGNNMILSGLHMTNMSINVNPYSVVTAQCDFVTFNPPATTGAVASTMDEVSADTLRAGPSHSGVIHGAYTTFSTGAGSEAINAVANVENFTYNYSKNMTVVYDVGNFEPADVFTSSIEHSVSFGASQWGKHLPLSGSGVSPSFALKNSYQETLKEITVSGSLSAMTFAANAGDVGRATYTIVQPLL